MKINVRTEKSYDVIVEDDIFYNVHSHISQLKGHCKLCIVTDSNVDSIYGNILAKTLKNAGFEVFKVVFPFGENSKNLKNFGQLLEFLAKNQFTHSDLLVSLGGGVIGDLTGYAASSYLRGIDYVQIPTTLLAAVDSSVGGKTGINLNAGKNQCGAFWQPIFVLCDPLLLNTLPKEILNEGMAEVIKYGAVLDKDFFNTLLNKPPFKSFAKIICRCVALKATVVEADERDQGKRQLLNFGHTVGHAIEKCSLYSLSHGTCVAMGMSIIAKAAYKSNLSKEDFSIPIVELLKKYNLYYPCPYSSEALATAALQDKKRFSDKLNLILLREIGCGYIFETDVSALKDFIDLGLHI